MTDCLECQRLKKQIKELEWKILSQVQRWIELKRFILDQEEKGKIPYENHVYPQS